jgi:hypothetical protein
MRSDIQALFSLARMTSSSQVETSQASPMSTIILPIHAQVSDLPQSPADETNLSSDFRMIPLGDLDLRSEIHQTTVSRRRTGRGYTGRIYSACVDGKNSKKTVALYQGRAAEEVCFHPGIP